VINADGGDDNKYNNNNNEIIIMKFIRAWLRRTQVCRYQSAAMCNNGNRKTLIMKLSVTVS
jgi:hypothetical protein